MEMSVFVRFHVREGMEGEAEEALRTAAGPSRGEAGCVSIEVFRSIRDGRLFYIHSKWKDEEAFEAHARLAHTVRLVGRMDELIDQPREVTKAEKIV
jgi:quinol monooxygenase YgiN